jgi:hypothetical protein
MVDQKPEKMNKGGSDSHLIDACLFLPSSSSHKIRMSRTNFERIAMAPKNVIQSTIHPSSLINIRINHQTGITTKTLLKCKEILAKITYGESMKIILTYKESLEIWSSRYYR